MGLFIVAANVVTGWSYFRL